jgi:hypothetical protein
VEKTLKHFNEYVVEEITLKTHESKMTPFHASSLGNGLNTFQFEIVQSLMSYGTSSCPN